MAPKSDSEVVSNSIWLVFGTSTLVNVLGTWVSFAYLQNEIVLRDQASGALLRSLLFIMLFATARAAGHLMSAVVMPFSFLLMLIEVFSKGMDGLHRIGEEMKARLARHKAFLAKQVSTDTARRKPLSPVARVTLACLFLCVLQYFHVRAAFLIPLALGFCALILYLNYLTMRRFMQESEQKIPS